MDMENRHLEQVGSKENKFPVVNIGGRPDPEVLTKPERRRFTIAYKLKTLEEADKCTEFGQIGALLRREGLYASQLGTWKRQKLDGSLSELTSRTRGRKVQSVNPLATKVEELEKRIIYLSQELSKATLIIDVQKKISQLLGFQLTENRDLNL